MSAHRPTSSPPESPKIQYIALISAARFHNITTQLPNTIFVFSPDYRRTVRVKGNYRVKFIKVNRKIMYGYNEYNGAYVSDVEKIFVDDVYYHRSLSYTEELETVLARRTLDVSKLKAYAKRLGRGDTARRLRMELKKFDIPV